MNDESTREAVAPLHVLVVGDNPDDADLLIRELRRRRPIERWKRVATAESMREALSTDRWDIIISDYSMPQFSALEALKIARESGLDLPFLIVSGAIGEDVAVSAIKAGAHDYLMKDNLARLHAAVERELREARERKQRREAEEWRREEAEISTALARVGRDMISSVNTPALLEQLCRVTTEVLECDCSYTLLSRAEDGRFVALAGFGSSAEEREAIRVLELPPQEMEGLLARLQTSDVARVVASEDRALLPMALLARQGVSNALFGALRRGGEIFGLHVAGYRDPRRGVSSRQVRIMQGIGQLASMALENARLFEALEQASRLKSDFVATISHELRTPLHIIMGYNTLLLEGAFGALGPQQLDAAKRIGHSANRLLELIEATLDLSRLEGGQVALDIKEIRIQDLMAEVKAFTMEARKKPGVQFVWMIDNRIRSVQTDPTKLKVVVQNLIDNAVKFTDEGRITVTAREHSGVLEICVDDTGVGIAPEVLPVIFEPFRQGDSSMTRRFEGVGLGLYIVQRMLDLLGGKVTVQSTVGKGSSFHIWLPFKMPAVSARAQTRGSEN